MLFFGVRRTARPTVATRGDEKCNASGASATTLPLPFVLYPEQIVGEKGKQLDERDTGSLRLSPSALGCRRRSGAVTPPQRLGVLYAEQSPRIRGSSAASDAGERHPSSSQARRVCWRASRAPCKAPARGGSRCGRSGGIRGARRSRL